VGTSAASFVVSLSAPSDKTITVTFTTADDSAKSADDYTHATGTVTFDPGQTSKTVGVTITGDITDELDETFTITLSSATNATIADDRAVGTILNDDGLPPGNDAFANGIVVTAIAGLYDVLPTTPGTTAAATAELGEPAHCEAAGSRTVWYRWTTPTDGILRAGDTTGTMCVALYRGTTLAGLTPVAYNRALERGIDVHGGTPYHIAVTSAHAEPGVPFELLVRFLSAPGNDAFANAIVVTAIAGPNDVLPTTLGTTAAATAEPGEPDHCGGDATRTVWYRWTPPKDGILQIRASVLMCVQLYRGTAVAGLTPLAYDRALEQGIDVQGGTPYHLALSTSVDDGPGVPFELLVAFLPIPDNDAFANAIVIRAFAGPNDPRQTTPGTTAAATAEPGEPAHCGGDSTRTVWYRWTSPKSGILRAGDTTGSMCIALYRGATLGALMPLAYNRALEQGIDVQGGGTPYHIAVTSNANGGAGVSFEIFVGFHPRPDVALVSSLNPAVFGQSVTLTVTVTSEFGTPTGPVTIRVGAVDLQTVQLNAAGVATFTPTTIAAGNYTYQASYPGDELRLSNESPILIQTVTPQATTTIISANESSPAYGRALTLTASVASITSGPITGFVRFLDGANVLGSAPVSGNVATLPVPVFLSAGAHTLTAVYDGDPNSMASTSAQLSVAIVKATTSVGLVSSSNPGYLGQPVTHTATIAPQFGGVPTGMVTFKVGHTTTMVTVINGLATVTTPFTNSVVAQVTAVYSGDLNFFGSSATPLVQTVSRPPTTLTLTSSSNPSRVGDSVTFTATVTSPIGAPPGEAEITFTVGGPPVTVPLIGGSATLTRSFSRAVTVSARYDGDNTTFTASVANLRQEIKP
jgi:hypothetical protein